MTPETPNNLHYVQLGTSSLEIITSNWPQNAEVI